MSTLGNILWFVFFGWWNCIVCGLLGFLFCFTIVGVPIGKACFQYAKLMLAPFGKVIVKETFIKGKENVSIIRRDRKPFMAAGRDWSAFGKYHGNAVLLFDNHTDTLCGHHSKELQIFDLADWSESDHQRREAGDFDRKIFEIIEKYKRLFEVK